MILLARAHLKAMADLAEAAYPDEACGLLVGRRGPGDLREVTRLAPSGNVAPDTRRRFEVDPGLRIGLERELRGGAEAVIGVWHSHPDGPAEPSAADLAAVYEPELVWLITSVADGQATRTQGFAVRDRRDGFRPLAIVEPDAQSKE